MTRLFSTFVLLLCATLHAEEPRAAALVVAGECMAASPAGAGWSQAEGAILCREPDKSSRLWSGFRLGEGDFRVEATLYLEELAGTAATFELTPGSHFGFEGGQREVFVEGPLFGGLRRFQPAAELITAGEDFEFVVRREGETITFELAGTPICNVVHGGAVETLAFRPWRARMGIREWRITGNLIERTPGELPLPQSFTIPIVDLDQAEGIHVVVDREEGQYLGHPTTVLLEDGKTILCVYPKGHGRGGIVYKRSVDGGRTWSERLPTPESWATSREVPTIHRVVDAEGVKRLIVWSGLHPARLAVSEDDGATWSELEQAGDWGGIVVMGCVIDLLEPGHYLAMFHDDGRFFRNTGRATGVFTLYQTLSTDGGLTWGEPTAVLARSDVHLCEPGAVRSPDGSEIAVLLRENSRTRNSHVIFSTDEGKSWTEPRELPAALTGDRHTGTYAPDGRLFLSFRDTAGGSPTKGDWCGWVGTYDDIKEGSEGQYRIRIKDNHHRWDCAYPGVELLPDGTFVVTTYGHWQAGAKPYILSARFTLAALEGRLDR